MPDGVHTQRVTLGCGTLILIALIVLLFSRSGTGDLERDVRALRSEVMELKTAVEAQTNEIKRLEDKVNHLQPGNDQRGKGKG